MLQVAQPLWCDKRDDADDGVAYGKDTPQHADRFGVADIICRVHVGGLDVLYLRTHVDVAMWLPISSSSMRARCLVIARPFSKNDTSTRNCSTVISTP